MFALTNARGEMVDINNDKLLSFTPTGLGVQFTNTYNRYETYFKATKSTVTQGQFQINIMFGDIESQSYQTFSDFAQFLAYQPLTLTYTTDSGTWYRDGRLNSLTKTEIGGSTVMQVDKLVESFTIEFINNWYNNKTAEYKSYEPDPNLGIYAKGYNTLGAHGVPEKNRTGQYNQVINSEFDDDLAGYSYLGTNVKSHLTVNKNQLYGYNALSYDGGISEYISVTTPLIPIKESDVSFSVRYYLKGKGSIQVSGFNSRDGSKSPDSWGEWTEFNYDDWTYVNFSDIKISNGDMTNNHFIGISINSTATTFSVGQLMLVFDSSIGDYVAGSSYGSNSELSFNFFYQPYYVYQESNRPSNEKVMSLNNGSQYFGLQQGSPSIITISNLDDGFYDPYWTVIKNGEIVASDGFHIQLASSQKLVVSSYPEDQYARIYNPDGSYVDVSQLQDYSKTNFVQIPEGSSTIIFYLSLNADVNITFKEERLLV